MRRREFIALLGGLSVTWPLRTEAQKRPPIIAIVGHTSSQYGQWAAALVERLGQLGWIDGSTVQFEYRWSEGRPERVGEIAPELVRQKVDVIVTYGAAAIKLKQATTSIPIVFVPAVDPLGIGLVANLSRPGGNVTGLSVQAADTAGKRLELLRQAVPSLRRLAIFFDASYPATVLEASNVEAAARTIGLDVAPHGIKRAEDIAPVFDALKGDADALFVVENALVTSNGERIIALAIGAKLPTTFSDSALARAGGLMSYGPSYPALFRRAAELVDKILRGANPADIPVEQPTAFDFVINLKTAKALELTIPDKLIVLADEVIE